ncbi:MAG: hypothetical protein IPJ19_11015 [Planctomycetes bacterium]|nr:hypothetical protein [Planctomycetota bacterium]
MYTRKSNDRYVRVPIHEAHIFLILVLAAIQCAGLDVCRLTGGNIDPQRARLLVPGATSSYEAIRILGGEPQYEGWSWEDGETSVWCCLAGDLSNPDSIRIGYVLEAHFGRDDKLLGIELFERDGYPADHRIPTAAWVPDLDLTTRGRIRVRQDLG